MKHLCPAPRRLAFGLALAAALAAAPARAQEKELSADAVAQRFLAHLDRNQPVAGVFEIHTAVDLPQVQGYLDETRKKGFVPEAAQQVLVCRWAWVTDREVCEQLEGSKDAPHSFLALPQGTLVGYPENKYNLLPPGKPRADVTRPALFYYLSGGPFWREYLASAKYSLGPATAQTPPGAVQLVATKEPAKCVLTVDRQTGKLYSAVIYDQGKPLWKLAIEEFATSPDGARVFPTKATISVYHDSPEKPFRSVTLTARRVDFPSTAEVAGEFKLPVPAKALIADRVLDAAIVPERATEASEIITKDVPRQPFTPVPAETEAPPPESRTRVVVTAVLLAAPLVLYGAYYLVRRRRHHASPPAGP